MTVPRKSLDGSKLTFGSLFAGIGGFDLGLERSGMVCKWQCENNKQCREILKKYWPGILCHENITENNPYEIVDLVCGGDPCPIRSRARSNEPSKHPDLSGYFLAVVGRCRPKWVVRENVPAPDDAAFVSCMELLGYGTAIIRINADTLTGQCRQRDFIVGCHQITGERLARMLPNTKDGPGPYTTRLGTRQIIPALTTHRTRYDSRDCYIYDSNLRILDGDERTAFAGFPKKWLDGYSEACIARMTGNAVVPQVVEVIGRMIIQIHKETINDKNK